MANPPTILVVDDEPDMLKYMSLLLEGQQYQVEVADSGTAALTLIKEGLTPNLILLDMNMPGLDGLETLEQIRQFSTALRVVMFSCIADTKRVVRAMQLGALDYLLKPVQQEELDAVLHTQIWNRQHASSGTDAAPNVVHLPDDTLFICASAAMNRIQAQAKLVATCEIPVLILGESGTGKEVIAHLIHHLSPRANRPFLKVNCAAVPADLLESELFGYEAGAFTGAVKSKPGKFEQCNNGTLLLDEIGEMPPELQAKLLHVLQDNEFSRLGGRSTTKVDVRVIAATNINIQEALTKKALRPDLYYRLNGLSLRLPPLRDRREEIPILLKHFMRQFSEKYARPSPVVSKRIVQACLAYGWPGNLRELQNFAKRYIVLGDEDLAISDLMGGMDGAGAAQNGDPEGAGKLKSIVRNVKSGAETIAIADALQQTNWKRKKAAALLGISYKALLYKMRQFGINPPSSAVG